ncbi:MAG: phosphatase [Blastopirellula sp.]|nr:MAG: phosphatase [Blastopirellula sp.]
MKYALLFSLLSVILTFIASTTQGWAFLLLWPALSFGIVSIGYFSIGPPVFGKSSQGILSPITKVLVLPYLLLLHAVWQLARVVSREPAYHQITEKVWIGRRLLSHELPTEIDHVIDLTCEFNEPEALRLCNYNSYQILDAHVPTLSQLRIWLNETSKLTGTLYIHCAQGHGRTGLFTAAYLFNSGLTQSTDDALKMIQSQRPLVRLNRVQLDFLRALDAIDKQ